MYGHRQGMRRLLGVGLLLTSASCADGDGAASTPKDPGIPAQGLSASLVQASNCDDLLTRIQDDAIAKLKLGAELAKQQIKEGGRKTERSDVVEDEGDAVDFGGSLTPPRSASAPAPTRNAGVANSDNVASDDDTSAADHNESATGSSASKDPSAAVPADSASVNPSSPTGASETNKQVQNVDEADFVKVVESGKGIFLLHGNTLRKIKSWPAVETQLVGAPLTIEGSPLEMFVTDAGKAVVFSNTSFRLPSSNTSSGARPSAPDVADEPEVDCYEGYCKGYYGSDLKITVADVSGATPQVERELYYQGSYVSARRYSQAGDVVRTIVQASTKFSGLFEPDIEWYDAWGRPYDDGNIASQLVEWEARTTAAIRKTTLAEWLPGAAEKKNGTLVAIEPACGSYFAPNAGIADYGLTHVLSLDVGNPAQPIGGVTVLGATSTVYSNAQQLVLAQPDYRWNRGIDFGVESGQQTALHVFDLAGAGTTYRASGFVPGQLPLRNPQFGIDVKDDGTIRLATTGFVRDNPTASPNDARFWQQHTENRVLTARVQDGKVAVIGKSDKLGLEGESVYSARFVGDRAYVVTYRETDPFIVVDVANPAAPSVLGEVKIPGFSEYMHPLDANHIITVGQSEQRGIQLQLYDVTNPMSIPQPKLLAFESGSSSEVSYQHKAFTFFEGVLAIPLSSYGYSRAGYGAYTASLELVRVDPNAGFTHLASIDHSALYADNGLVSCGYCDARGCGSYSCGYTPEVRRGVFVKGDSGTYVYSVSYAGVLVNDLANPSQVVAKVGLPAPGGYGYEGKPIPTTRPSAEPRPGVALDAGSAVAVDLPAPAPTDGGSASAADAGVPPPAP